MKLFYKVVFIFIIGLVISGLLVPEKMIIPVEDATTMDWNHETFWFEPWGSSGVHKGIDIFGEKGKPVIAATTGVVVFVGSLSKGGNAVAILGPKWRIHYYSHLNSYSVNHGDFVSRGDSIGALGDTGNAAGKQPHLHYSILTLVPMPWLITFESQGWKRMFYLDPHQKLSAL